MTRPADLTSLDARLEQIADMVAEARCPNPFPLPRDIDHQLLLVSVKLMALLVELRKEGTHTRVTPGEGYYPLQGRGLPDRCDECETEWPCEAVRNREGDRD